MGHWSDPDDQAEFDARMDDYHRRHGHGRHGGGGYDDETERTVWLILGPVLVLGLVVAGLGHAADWADATFGWSVAPVVHSWLPFG